MSQICYRWGFTNVLWKNANWKWSECQLVAEILNNLYPGVDATTLIQPWLIEPWNPYKEKKRKELIRLICKCRGQTYDESKEVKEFEITVDDIKLVVRSVSGIELDIK